MKDMDLYSRILGLAEPWFVEAVELDTVEGRVDIRAELSPGVRWACPIWGRDLTCRDHTEPRTWRHLDTCQFKLPAVQFSATTLVSHKCALLGLWTKLCI